MTQTKLSHKQIRWADFLSQFNFHIAHIPGKHNLVVDALSRRPQVNAVSIATHNDLSFMMEEYATDLDFRDVMSAHCPREERRTISTSRWLSSLWK